MATERSDLGEIATNVLFENDKVKIWNLIVECVAAKQVIILLIALVRVGIDDHGYVANSQRFLDLVNDLNRDVSSAEIGRSATGCDDFECQAA